MNHAATSPELFDGFTDLLLTVADVNVLDPERWSQQAWAGYSEGSPDAAESSISLR